MMADNRLLSKEDKIAQLKDEFQNDSLRKLIYNEGLDEELFGDDYFYEHFSLERSYSTKDAADLLRISNEHNIRNTLSRYNLSKYVEVRYINTRIVLDYPSVFRLKMIFFLRQRLNKKPIQIAEYVGLLASTGQPNTASYEARPEQTPSNNTFSQEDMMQTLLLNQRREMLDFKLDIKEDQRDKELKRVDREIDSVKDQIELIQYLKDIRNDYEEQKIIQSERLNLLKSKITFKNLFRKEWGEDTISPEQLKEKINETKVKKLLEKEDTLKQEIEKLGEERQYIHKSMSQEIEKLEGELYQLENRMDDVKNKIGSENHKWLE